MLGETKITTCTRNFFRQTTFFFKLIPAPEYYKNQELNSMKYKKINRTVKLCTLATNDLILTPDHYNAENPKLSKQTLKVNLYHITITCMKDKQPY